VKQQRCIYYYLEKGPSEKLGYQLSRVNFMPVYWPRQGGQSRVSSNPYVTFYVHVESMQSRTHRQAMMSHDSQRITFATASVYLAVPGVLNVDDARRLFL
jgi:hypothetical protein